MFMSFSNAGQEILFYLSSLQFMRKKYLEEMTVFVRSYILVFFR